MGKVAKHRPPPACKHPNDQRMHTGYKYLYTQRRVNMSDGIARVLMLHPLSLYMSGSDNFLQDDCLRGAAC